jgi:predicted  nucleic acid-binding Zn-ribbon protein
MSLTENIFTGIRKIIQLDSEVQRLREGITKLDEQVDGHERRLIRIEALIEFSRTATAPRLPEN